MPVVVVDVSAWFDLPREGIERIGERFAGWLVVDSIDSVRCEDREKIAVVFGAPAKRRLKDLAGLKWLHLPSSGMNGYDEPRLYARETRVTSSAGVYGGPISEYVLAQMLMLSKGLHSAVIHNKCGYGNDIQHATGEFSASTVLVIGVGDIGRNVARRSKALGATVLGIRRDARKALEDVDRMYAMDELDEIVGLADFVVLSLPQSSETNDIINSDRLRRMKRTAVLVNVGRGNAVNQRDLRRALRKGWIAAAALDVTVPEPLLPNSPTFNYRELVCSLHHASISERNAARAVDVFLHAAESGILLPESPGSCATPREISP